MSETPPIHCIIATHGPPRMLRRTLASLAESAAVTPVEAVWVAENGSDAEASQICEQMVGDLPVRYEHLPQPGKNAALAHVLGQVGDGLVILTDDDVRVNREFFGEYVQAAAKHGADAVYGGPLLIDYDEPPREWLRPYLPASVVGWEPEDPGAPITGPIFLGANYGAFAERIRAVGGFEPDLGPGSAGNSLKDELDVQGRLFADGCRGVYLPNAKVWHHVPAHNCTPRWMLERARRVWVANGQAERKPIQGNMLRGVPRWMWRWAARRWLVATAANLVPDPKRRFELKLPYHQWRGYMTGVRLRLQREQADA